MTVRVSPLEFGRSFVTAIGVAAFVLLADRAAVASAQADPAALQKQGIARVGEYIDNSRRTGDQTSLLPQLGRAQQELTASYNGFLATADFRSATLSALTLGDIARMQSRWDAALTQYDTARSLAVRARDPGYQSRALVGKARIEMLRGGSLSVANDHLGEAIQLASASKNKKYLFDALDFASQVEVKRGNLAAAGAYMDRALALSGETGDKASPLFGYLDRADVYLKRAEKCDYERSFEVCDEALKLARADYQQALQIAQSLGFNAMVELAHGFLGDADARDALNKMRKRSYGQFDSARLFHPRRASDVLVTQRFRASGTDSGTLRMIEAISRQVPGLLNAGDARASYVRATLQQLRGKDDSALSTFLHAVDLLERDRRSLHDEQSRGTFLEDKIDFYYAPVLELLERRRLAEAFRLLEQSRSHAMADLLASRTLGLGKAKERDLFSASVKLRAEIASAQQSLFNEVAAGARENQSAKISALETQISGREAAYQQVQARMGREAPKLAALMVSEPATLESVQRAAGAGGYDVLYYLVLEHAVILWHIDSQGAQVWNVFFPRSELMKDVGSLRDNLTDRARNEQSRFDAQTARELFLFLIQPALASIHTHHLVILPHEDLNALPFQVLQNPVDGTYLGERYQVSYAPSASVLATLAAQNNLAGGRLLAVADPGIGDAAREVEAIGKLYPGRSKVVDDVLVKKDDVKAWASDYNLLHLSVHGKFDPGNPLLSYLSFRSTPTDDGRLTAAEMFGLPLPRNAFVVLSACETGRVEATHANEVVGMVRGLLYAGASNVVLSLWEVQSQATALWMETFYREAQTHTPTESARLALIAVKARPEYQHPYFWGPFVMTGK